MLAVLFATLVLLLSNMVSADEQLMNEAIQLCQGMGDELCTLLLPSAINKRKASFVRFGKRSSSTDGDEQGESMEKRKASFVRFGKRSSTDGDEQGEQMEKRKASFIRFGR